MVRLKNRYLMTEVVWYDQNKRTPLSESWLFQFISNEIKTSVGELTYESFKKNLKCIIYVNPDTNLFIIRVSFEYYKSLWTAFSLITSYYDVPVYFRVIHVGGSIRNCHKAAIKVFNKEITMFSRSEQDRFLLGEKISDDEDEEIENDDDEEIEHDEEEIHSSMKE
ncbi:hypothetical protein DICPUDRAFT_152321 [Dictyostelium purpureum]|uniref:Uncharacterized protein n=1 Tax=Dictyostelium purpureum TaxID=5786 RepID=F0ZL23_DICPU|nr:uncharacterized protein DICPUDRAFT_152321 [Dictyostelium purpureum]EGC35364.1 hypothetical protein DICPUDRAFT_152321 [Dictyostelium purpureum]|eukprot:XP_003288102.1 hypothetical protein DICPUDRAFT_152321 [Dictyostelium purpureum]